MVIPLTRDTNKFLQLRDKPKSARMRPPMGVSYSPNVTRIFNYTSNIFLIFCESLFLHLTLGLTMATATQRTLNHLP